MTLDAKSIAPIGYPLCAAALCALAVACQPQHAIAAETGNGDGVSAAQAESSQTTNAVHAPTKDETVYVYVDSAGAVKRTEVTTKLGNPDALSQISDVTSLSDIEVEDGSEDFTRLGSEVVWNADGKDVTYKGSSFDAAPVSIKVTYTLDGVNVDPADLAGKNGHVVIRFDYENNTAEPVSVKGKLVEVCTPFTAITGLMLDQDVFSNVKVENGRIVQDGDRTVVIGYAMPGLRQSLDIGDDFDVPEYFQVEADVQNFELKSPLTMVSPNLLDDIDTSDFDTSELEGVSADLNDAMAALIEGSDTLGSGLGELADAAKTASDGTRELASGVNEVDDGAKAVFAGTSNVAEGAVGLATGISSAVDGASALESGAQDLANGLSSLKGGFDDAAKGTDALVDGADALAGGLGSLRDGSESAPGLSGAQAGASQLSAGIGDAAGNLGDAAGGIEQGVQVAGEAIDGAVMTLDVVDANAGAAGENVSEARAQVEALVNADVLTSEDAESLLDSLDRADSAIAGIDTDGTRSALTGAKDTLDAIGEAGEAIGSASSELSSAAEQAGQLSEGLKGAIEGIDSLEEGSDALKSGLSDLKAGTDRTSQALDDAVAGSGKLADGATALKGDSEGGLTAAAAGAHELATGASEVASGAGKLADGTDALGSGSTALAEASDIMAEALDAAAEGGAALTQGLQVFNDEGISEIGDAIDNRVLKLSDRFDAITAAGKRYTNFGGIAAETTGSVKFVYEMDGISLG